MSFRYVEQGIGAIQAGNLDEGVRLLRIALKDPELTGGIRAIACLWLAETTTDPNTKRAYYDAALAAAPDDPEIRHRVERWLAAQLPTPPTSAPTVTPPPQPAVTVTPQVDFSPPPTTPPPPGTLPGMPAQPAYSTPPTTIPGFGTLPPSNIGHYRIAGVIGGPNGAGTAFFVLHEGILVTTRYVVGSLERVTVELETGYQIPGRVVRSFPELDLALIVVQQPVSDILPVTPLPRIPEETPLMAMAYNGQSVRGSLRTTKRILSPHWFPTTITQPPDAGGNPVFDDNRYLVGMLTRNASASSANLYGIHISGIMRAVETYKQDIAQGKLVYCPTCGDLSKAAANGGHYCETCGGLMPQAGNLRRNWHDTTNTLYHEQNRIACRHCSAHTGFYQGKCLRCGREQT
ncbi:MAG: trypsin-like peptidase domain-containing protein [Chloroflexi bacterium]|nr:trypsin-like peptidase domain-containing protein [Chloroflexota bacterium]